MFISKKAFDKLFQALTDARDHNIKMIASLKEISAELSRREQEIADLKRVKRFYTTKWVTITCPSCDHAFEMHTLKE